MAQALESWKHWQWPLPVQSGARPVVSQEFHQGHLGLDIMYGRAGSWYCPPGTPVLAVADGTIWSVTRSPRGIEVVVDHGAPFATYNQHLASATVSRGSTIRKGDPIGTVGFDPLDPARLPHLHFAVWWQGYGNGASINPARVIHLWSYKTI